MSNARKRYSMNFPPLMTPQTRSAGSPTLVRRSLSGNIRDTTSSFQKWRDRSFATMGVNSVVGSTIPSDIDPSSISNCKILLIGDSNVGKTAAILGYCDELMTRSQWQRQRQRQTLMKHSNYSQPNIGTNQINSIPTTSHSPINNTSSNNSLGLIQRKQKLLSRDKATSNKKRYSLNDFEELAKRRSILFQRDGSLLSPKQHSTETFLPTEDPLIVDDLADDLTDDNELIIDTRATIGVDIKTRLLNIDNRYFNCIMWDTAGQERFQNAIIPSLYKNCNGILLTYDICDFVSFQHCFTRWLPQALQNMNSRDLVGARFYLLGNKIDLYKDRKVEHEDVLRYIAHAESQHGITIFGNFEISCKWPQSIDSTFNNIILDLIENSCYEDNRSSHSPPPSPPPSHSLSHSPRQLKQSQGELETLMTNVQEEVSSSDDDASVYSASSHRSNDSNRTLRQRNPKQTIDLTNPLPAQLPDIPASSCCT
ncbi:similar to Saccharomyces cerevisiae YNL304W YPT11 Rab family GTPase that interacts with the C-terminal tail domain of Myo2p [Maudiozyma saulgeensis]|uniref:Similar to Saccharomyces cerevisiae YNL304W YPT11 Rab family GTPase that interacts with the C-terminal tail domain of Myo2p n=1 Tax=Maudiozyma saulgeensis TaxID=1789683 RepID=A0A1X7R1Z9_9SACH|nr:similar to Saccharomyces cerevisiae YNL304W YPT11 Rab family GTPase that interacts with the C-terminal tail domain of Myo2p [Kazachstania saulgeensis]